jgi:parvulin-like peptidyl-prolyl isomerase
VQRYTAIFRLGAILVCAAALAACSSSDPASPTSSAIIPDTSSNPLPAPPTLAVIDPAALPTDSAGLPLAASVNGEGIRYSTFERAYERAIAQQFIAADPATLRASVLSTLIEQIVVAQDASRRGLMPSDAEVELEVQNQQQLAGGADAWQSWLAANQYTEGEYREAVRMGLLYSRMIEQVTNGINGDVPQVRARHILTGSEAEANAIMERLRNGEDFAAVASQVSLDMTTRANGGDLGWFAQEELVDPALATIAFSLEPMQIAGPVPTTLGYHIIQALERGSRPLTEERKAQVAQRQFEDWLASLVAAATIQRFI